MVFGHWLCAQSFLNAAVLEFSCCCGCRRRRRRCWETAVGATSSLVADEPVAVAVRTLCSPPAAWLSPRLGREFECQLQPLTASGGVGGEAALQMRNKQLCSESSDLS